MKRGIMAFLILSSLSIFQSCSDLDDPIFFGSEMIGTYEYFNEEDDRFIEVRIVNRNMDLIWSFGSNQEEMIVISESQFEVKPYESFDYATSVEGELIDDVLVVVHKIFELSDLNTPVTIEERMYDRVK